MVKNVYLLMWLALFSSGITARTSCAQTPPDLPVRFDVSDNFLLARADAGSDVSAASKLTAPPTLRPDGCEFAPVSSTPLSLEPAPTDRSFDQGATYIGQKHPSKPQLRFALAPLGPCTGTLRIDLTSPCAAQPAFGLTLWNSGIRMMGGNAILVKQPPREGFHLRAALLQSLGFLMLEHGFRFANDPYLRYLVFHKPFWHDYLASAGRLPDESLGRRRRLSSELHRPSFGRVGFRKYFHSERSARARGAIRQVAGLLAKPDESDAVGGCILRVL